MPGALASISPRWVAGGAAAIAYAALTHVIMTQAADWPWSPAVALGPVIALGAVALWRAGQRALSIVCIAAFLFLLTPGFSGQSVPTRWFYLAQHAGIHLALAVWFGSTLRRGVQPLISMLAQRVHGSLTPAMTVYTRNVTVAWMLYFVAVSSVSLVLFFAGDFRHWSLLANLLTPVLTTSMFVGEYLVRYRLHPEFERTSLYQALQAWNGAAAKAQDSTGAADR